MKIQEIYNLAVKMGIEADFREKIDGEELEKQGNKNYSLLRTD